MKKKQKDEIKKFVQQVLTSGLLNQLQNAVKNIIHKTQEITYHTEKKIEQRLFAFNILFGGCIFITIGLTFLINNLFKLESQWGFLIMGGILVLIGFIFMTYMRKTRLFKF